MEPIIPKDANADVRTWHAPRFGAAGGVSVSEQHGMALPTARDLEAVFDKARAQGLEDGRRQGLAEGRTQGMAEGRAQAGAELEAVRGLLRRLHEPVAKLDAELETAVVTLALEIARQVVMQELRTRPEQVLDVLQRALAAFPAQIGTPWVRLHPDDIALLQSIAPELEEGGMSLVADESLQRGDLVLATGGDGSRMAPERRWRPRAGRGEVQSELDLRLEERWRQVLARLFEEGSL